MWHTQRVPWCGKAEVGPLRGSAEVSMKRELYSWYRRVSELQRRIWWVWIWTNTPGRRNSLWSHKHKNRKKGGGGGARKGCRKSQRPDYANRCQSSNSKFLVWFPPPTPPEQWFPRVCAVAEQSQPDEMESHITHLGLNPDIRGHQHPALFRSQSQEHQVRRMLLALGWATTYPNSRVLRRFP